MPAEYTLLTTTLLNRRTLHIILNLVVAYCFRILILVSTTPNDN